LSEKFILSLYLYRGLTHYYFCCPWNYSGSHKTLFRFRQPRCLPLIRFARTYEFRSLRSLHSSENFIIRFWINKFFQYRFHNIVSLYSVVNVQANPNRTWISQLKSLRFFFFAIYYFNFGFNSSALSWLLPSSLTCLRGLQTGGFLSELFYLIASSFIVNYIFYISLHVC